MAATCSVKRPPRRWRPLPMACTCTRCTLIFYVPVNRASPSIIWLSGFEMGDRFVRAAFGQCNSTRRYLNSLHRFVCSSRVRSSKPRHRMISTACRTRTRLPRYHELMAQHDPVPLPEDWALNEHGVDVRVVNAPWVQNGPSAENGIRMWIRANGKAPDDYRLHAAMLAYQSDESLADNLLIPFNKTWSAPGVFCVSLDHAMWFHRPVDMNQWHFVEQQVVGAANNRGVGTGYVWSTNKRLVASFTQEVLMRFESSAN